jgi:hypothetical protein
VSRDALVSYGSGITLGVHEVRSDVFREPDDPDITIWRYIDLAKLLSLLSSSTLWFSRADRLGDPHEGSLGAATRRALLEVQEQFIADNTPSNIDPSRLETDLAAFARRLATSSGARDARSASTAGTWTTRSPSRCGGATPASQLASR